MPADDQYIGEISIVAFNFAPKLWAQCNGQLLPISQNQALFSILGTTYGGNGTTNFALPDFRGKAPLHWGNSQSAGNYVLGQMSGVENQSLLTTQIPQHKHTISNPVVKAKTGSSPANNNSPVNNYFTENTAEVKRFTALPDTVMGTISGVTIPNQGGSSPHNNMQPYLVVNFIIALAGRFPSRN